MESAQSRFNRDFLFLHFGQIDNRRTGFARVRFIQRAFLGRRGDEIVGLAKVNLFRA
jgi:hypothetical protein